LARVALAWERVWPALWPALAIAGLYLAAALFGLIARIPAALHGLVQAAVLAAIAFVVMENFHGLRWPSWLQGARRVERDSHLAHRPITEAGDTLSAGVGDAQAEALWRLHLTQLLSRIANLRVALPRPGLQARDHHGLRFVLLLLIIGGVVFAGRDWGHRIVAALAPDAAMGASTAGIDAWIDPPAYTGMAPLYLPRDETREIAVPAGSVLEVRVHEASAKPHFALDPAPSDRPSFTGAHKEYAARYRIASTGLVRVRVDGRTLGDWRLQAIPDLPPAIAFAQPPSRTEHDAVKFAFTGGDDYGVVGVRALIRPVGKPGKMLAVDLPLSAPGKTINETLYRDLTENPYAGLDVTITLEAKDGAGQTALSKPAAFHLPARIFTNPLARALVEQRQILAMDAPGARGKVEEMLDALSIAPQIFYKDQNAAWLSQRAIFKALTSVKTPADMARVEDLLWQTALSLDQAGLATAQEELRRIQQLLSQALAQGAPQDVIDQLMERYRQAMEKYLRMMAQNAKPGQPGQQGQAMNVSPQDLDKLLKALEDAAKSGSRQAANQMLSMLQSLLENLHMQQGGAGSGGFAGNDKALSDAIQGLSDLLGRQRELMDKTYRQQQGTGDPKDGGSKGLADQQGKLKDDLDKVLKALKSQKGKTPDSLGQAGHEMGDAQNKLGGDALGDASQSQKQALEDMRKGVGDLANQLMAEQQQQQGREAQDQDPLGRGTNDNAGGKVPDKSTLERARSILQELRKRAAEQGRPKRELDYIDRLLKEF
jgi:uncharacterized protein (TIGR02302 family)